MRREASPPLPYPTYPHIPPPPHFLPAVLNSLLIRPSTRKLSVEGQPEVRDVTLLFKIINGLAPSYLARKMGKRSDAHSYSTRNKDQLQSFLCRTATAQRSFSYRSINTWNSLCFNSRDSESLSNFKKSGVNDLAYKL